MMGIKAAYSTNLSGFEIINQTNSEIVLKYKSGYSGDKSFPDNSGNVLNIPIFENAISEYDVQMNRPEFISKALFISPDKDACEIFVKSLTNTEIPNYRFSPVPEYELQNITDFNSINIKINSPKNDIPFIIKYAGSSRNQHLAELNIRPVRYNPTTQVLNIIDSALIIIKFDITKANISPKANDFNSMAVLNYQMGKFWQVRSNSLIKDMETLQGPKGNTISSLSNGEWGRIVIEDEGIYKLDASDLSAIGIPSTSEVAKTLKIFGKGGKNLSEVVSDGINNDFGEQEIIVRTKPDGSIESVIFYAAGTTGFEERGGEIRHYKNFYSDKNYYLITYGGNDGLRANALINPNGDVLYKPTVYTERMFVDEDIVNPYNPGAGRDWFGRSFFSSPMPPVMLHDLDRNGEIKYRFALAHKSTSNGVFNIYENNESIGTIALNANGSYIAANRGFRDVVIPASKIASDNRSIIKFQYQNSLISSIGYFDYYELAYPRSFFAVNNSIKFIADKGKIGLTEYNMNGFNGEIFGFDISDIKNPKLLTNKSTTGGMYSFIYDISNTKLNVFYVSSNLKKAKLEKIEIKNLRENSDNAKIVVITHPDLYESALKFKEYRSNTSGKKVEVYKTNHIYNEYSATIPDVTAIRDFMIDIYNRWSEKPEYLVLWGDGHYDYKNLATNKTNYIPAYQTYRANITAFSEIEEAYATDDFYALIEGDDLMVDVNFGRVTIDNPELGFWIVDKIKHYETSSSKDIWRTNMIFVADDGPADGDSYEGGRHSGQTENLQKNYIFKGNPDLQNDKIYLVEYPTLYIGSGRRKPSVTDDMLTRINTTGGLYLNWIGHGNPRVWSHEQILDRDVTIPKMRNLDKLFFLTAATCDYGRFDDPEVRSGAEDMFLSKNGGAIGVFSATRIVYSDDNARLAYAFYSRLMTRNPETGKYPSLGETIKSVKQNFNNNNDRKFFLIGDPTLTLLMPDYKVNIKKINTTEITSPNQKVNLPALSKVTIEGQIDNPLTNQIDESYNGTIVVTLRDGDIAMKIQDVYLNIQRGIISFDKLGGSLNRSSYKVENGRFTAEFIIPKDISFSDSLGRLFLYSASEDGKFGSGSFHNIEISGFSNIDDRDTIPPQIDIYLDGRKFISGDVVTINPKLIVDLFDESGINTTGLGIGHKIEAWIDDSPFSIDLTDKFSSSLLDSRRGTVEDILFGLSPGEHKIRIRAWDVFNNFSVSEVTFVIPAGGDGGLLTNIYNYPNPFSESTNIVFRHNALPPFELNVDIFTINGILIRNINNTLNTLHTSEIFWDGRDNSGNKCADGIYLFNVKLRGDNGTTLGRGKLVKIGN
jgi:hypothetical protein